jgi:hypothetical protein
VNPFNLRSEFIINRLYNWFLDLLQDHSWLGDRVKFNSLFLLLLFYVFRFRFTTFESIEDGFWK